MDRLHPAAGGLGGTRDGRGKHRSPRLDASPPQRLGRGPRCIVEAGLACALLPAIYAVPGGPVVYFRLAQRPRWLITLCSRKDGWLGQPEQLFIALCREYWREKTV